MAKRDIAALNEVLEEAAHAGAVEITQFLKTWHGKDQDARVRVQVAGVAVRSYTQYRASQNNLMGMVLMAAKQTGLSRAETLNIAKAAGLLPSTAATSAAE